MITIDDRLLNKISEQAKQSPRLRMNFNFHETLDEPVNRFLNAIEPDSYIRPHRHKNPAKREIFLLLRGRGIFFTFDDNGQIIGYHYLSPADEEYGIDVDGDVWHCFLSLKTNTVAYEVKEGPFTPIAPEDLAPWSPDANDTEAVKKFMAGLREFLETI